MDHMQSLQRPTRRRIPGHLCVALAAVLWSLSGLFAKAPMFDAWSADVRGPLLAFWRALFAGLFMLPLVRRPRWSLKLVPMTLCFAGMNVTYLTAMSLTTGANAIWLQSTAPWWVFLYGVVWSRERISRADLIPLVCAMLGVGTILAYELPTAVHGGTLYGLASGVLYAGVVIALRALRSEDAAWLVVANHLVTAAVIAPYVVHLGVWPSGAQLRVLAVFGLLQMAVPYALFSYGLRTVTAQEAIVIGLLEPLLLPVWSYAARGEVPATWTLLGAGLILAGMVLRYAQPILAWVRLVPIGTAPAVAAELEDDRREAENRDGQRQ